MNKNTVVSFDSFIKKDKEVRTMDTEKIKDLSKNIDEANENLKNVDDDLSKILELIRKIKKEMKR